MTTITSNCNSLLEKRTLCLCCLQVAEKKLSYERKKSFFIRFYLNSVKILFSWLWILFYFQSGDYFCLNRHDIN